MEDRVKKLEEEMIDVRRRLTAIEHRLTEIEALLKTFPELFATKADLLALQQQMERRLADQTAMFYQQLNSLQMSITQQINQQTWRLVTYVTTISFAMVSATYFIASHVK